MYFNDMIFLVLGLKLPQCGRWHVFLVLTIVCFDWALTGSCYAPSMECGQRGVNLV